MIREMNEEDWKRVEEIYLQGIEKGTATFNTKCPSYEEWDNGHIDSCRFVYVDDEYVVGWIAISPTSSRCVYKGCVEMSVYVDSNYQGRGIGTKLVAHLLQEAQIRGYWSVYSTVISINTASIALHKKCGFREIGYREKVAKDRFGNWQNTTLFELRLERKAEKPVNYHIEKAKELFGKKFHCSQAVFAAFSEELGITEEQALKIGACFGSGIRKGEVCGACSGALMALGLKYGQADENDIESRMKTNEVSDRFMEEFKKENGSYMCKELLGCDLSTEEGIAEAIEKKLFTEFCPKMVESAAKIAKKMLV